MSLTQPHYTYGHASTQSADDLSTGTIPADTGHAPGCGGIPLYMRIGEAHHEVYHHVAGQRVVLGTYTTKAEADKALAVLKEPYLVPYRDSDVAHIRWCLMMGKRYEEFGTPAMVLDHVLQADKARAAFTKEWGHPPAHYGYTL